jgi:hypothetical protein
MKKLVLICTLALAVGLSGLAVHAVEESAEAKPAKTEVYPLDFCPVGGGKLGSMGDPVVKTIEGREVRFCCGGCPAKMEADPAKFFAKVDAAIIEQQKPTYALDKCPVGGGKVDDESIDLVHNNRLVRLCCADCEASFEKDATAHLAKLDAAVIEKQSENYPFDYCVVAGEALEGKSGAADVVVGGELFKICCAGCEKGIAKEPSKYLTMLSDARAGKEVERPEGSKKD